MVSNSTIAILHCLLLHPFDVNCFLIGYGIRFPTERNQMTLPSNVPLYRKPPDTERFLAGTRPTQMIKKDDKAIQRNAQQLVFQTSGEIGAFHYGLEKSDVEKWNKKPLSQQTILANTYVKPVSSDQSVSTARSGRQESGRIETGRSGWTESMPNTERSGQMSFRDHTGHNYGSTDGMNTSRSKYIQTLHNLDPSFGRKARGDLIIATQPPKPKQELVWLATANDRYALQSKPWALKLRRSDKD